jgi:hypothetical protein
MFFLLDSTAERSGGNVALVLTASSTETVNGTAAFLVAWRRIVDNGSCCRVTDPGLSGENEPCKLDQQPQDGDRKVEVLVSV